MVRLLQYDAGFVITIYNVSIPQWCDCCPQWLSRTVDKMTVSIPQWCDCCWAYVGNTGSAAESFNPTMVRLLHKMTLREALLLLGFNPTMVRLLRDKHRC